MNEPHPTGTPCTGDELRTEIERLFHTPISMSLIEWGGIANKLLYAAHILDQHPPETPTTRQLPCLHCGTMGESLDDCEKCGELITPY